MKKLHVLFLLVSLITLSAARLYAQQPSKIRFESEVSGRGLEICSDSNTITIRIKNVSEEDLTNFKINEVMPVGISYMPGSVVNAVEVNPMLLPNAPVFSIDSPFVLLPDQILEISFKVRAGCALVALAESGTLIQDQTSISYETVGSPIVFVETRTSSTYNILYPVPMVTAITPEPLIGNIGYEYARTIKVSNPGNGNLNGFWLSLKHSAGLQTTSIKVGASPDYLITAPSTTSSTFDMVYIPVAIASDGSILIEQKFKILNCNAGGTEIKTLWGCGSEICDSSDVFMANTVPSFGVPKVVIAEESFSAPDLCGNNGTVTYKYTNNGTETTPNGGVATDMRLSFAHDPNRVNLSSFEISPDGSTWSAISATAPNTSTKMIDLSTVQPDPDGVGAEGVEDYNSDGKNELAITKYFYIRFTITLNNVGIFSQCGPNFEYNYSTPSIHYDDQCLSNPEDLTYNNLKRSIKVKTCGIKGKGPIDMAGASDSTFTFCINDAEISGTSCTNPSYTARIFIPAGMTFVAGSATYNGSPVTETILAGGTVATIPGTSASGCYSIKLHLNCNTTPGVYEEDKTVNWQIEYNCNPLATCPTGLLACDSIKFKAKYLSTCSKSCAANSIETSSFKANRATFGYADETLTSPKLNAATSGVRLNAVYPCDSIKVTVKGNQNGNISAPFMDIRYTLPGGITDKFLLIDPTTAVCVITYKYTPTGPTTTMNCPFPLLTVTPGAPVLGSGETTFIDHFAWTCVPPSAPLPVPPYVVQPIIVSYEITARYYVSNPALIPAGSDYTIKDFRAQYYWFSAIPVPPPIPPTPPSGPFTCSSVGARMNVINPGNRFESSYSSVFGCDNAGALVQLKFITYGGCGSGDDFPNEFRQVGTMSGSINANIPTGFTYVPGSAVYATSGPDGTTMNATFVPPGTFMHTGTSWPLQDKYTDQSVQTFSFKIAPSCNANAGWNSVPLTYNWINKDYAGLGSSCYSINPGQLNSSVYYYKPDLRQLPFETNIYADPKAKLKVRVANYSRYAGTENTWIAFETMSNNFEYASVKDGATPVTMEPAYGAVNNTWSKLGSVVWGSEKIIELDAKYKGCTDNPEELKVKSSWSCEGYPLNPTLATCPVNENTLFFHRRYANVQAEFTKSTIDFCNDATDKYIELEVRNIDYGRFFDPALEFKLPAGFDYLNNSMEFKYGGPWTSISNPGACTVPLTNCFRIAVNDASAPIATDGLPSPASDPNYKFSLRYKLNAECGSDFSSVGNKNQMDATLTGRSYCNEPITRAAQTFPKVSNIPPPDYTYSHPVFTADDINKCVVPNNSLVHVKIVNDGAGSTGTSDYIKIILPPQVTYNATSYSNISNASTAPTSTAGPGTGETTLSWNVPSGIAAGNAIEFTFTVSGASTLTTGTTVPFKLVTGMQPKAYCATSGEICSTEIVRKWTRINVNIVCDSVTCENDIQGDTLVCIGDTLQYTAGMYPNTTYSWQAFFGTIISQNDPQVDVRWDALPGALVLTTKDTLTNCITIDTLIVLLDTNCNIIDTCNLKADAGPDKYLCGLDSVQIGGSPTATGGAGPGTYSYLWIPAAGLDNSTSSNPMASPLVKTTYLLIVRSGTCSDTDSVVVYPRLVVDAGPDQTICSTTITTPFPSPSVQTAAILGKMPFTATGGNGPGTYTYSWTPTSGLNDPSAEHPVATPTVTTTYTVTVTSGECTLSDSVVVTVTDCTKPCLTENTISGDSQACPGDTIQYSAIYYPHTLYGWATAGGTIISQNDPDVVIAWNVVPTTLTLITFDTVNYCMAFDTLNITPDSACSTLCNVTADAGPDTSLCALDSVQIGGAPTATGGTGSYTYLWTPASGLSDPTVANPYASPLVTTTYTLIVTSGSCSDTDMVTVVPKLVVDAGPDKEICRINELARILGITLQTSTVIGGTFTATGGTGSYTYSWTPTDSLSDPSSPNPVANPSVTTTYTVTVTSGDCTLSDSMTVIVKDCTPEPCVDPAGSNLINHNTIYGDRKACPGDTVTYSADYYSGTNYVWIPTIGVITSENDPYVSIRWDILPAMLVLATYDSVNFCVTLDTIFVTLDSNCVTVSCDSDVIANAGPDKSLCGLDSVQIGGSPSATGGTGSYTYLWTPALGLSDPTIANPYASPLVTTTYMLIVVSGSCSDTDSVTVVPRLIVDAGADRETCRFTVSIKHEENSVTFSTIMPTVLGGIPNTASGGTGSYTYSWTPISGLNDPTAAQPVATPGSTTTYVVSVTSGTCTLTDTVVVTVIECSSPCTAENSISGDSTACIGDTIAYAAASSYPNTIYAWNAAGGVIINQSGPNVEVVWAALPGTLTLMTLDTVEFCTFYDTIFVTLDSNCIICDLVADAGPDKELCGQNSVVIGGSPTATGGGGPGTYTYLWSPSTGLSSSTVANPSASPTIPTLYILQVTSGTCKDVDSVMVYPKMVVDAGPDQIICNGPTPSQSGTGTYPPEIVIGGDPTAEGGKGTYTYNWTPVTGLNDPTVSNPVAKPTATTAYIVQATSGTCTLSDTVTVTVKDCALSCFINASFTWNNPPLSNTVQFSGQATPLTGTIVIGWSWNFGDGGNASVQNPSHTYASANKYAVTLVVTAVNAVGDTCVDSFMVNQVPVGNPTQWPIPMMADPNERFDNSTDQKVVSVLGMELYPNPFSKQAVVIIDLPSADKVELNVLDMEGRLVQRLVNDDFEKGSHSFNWNAEDLRNPALYIIQLKTNSGVKYLKAVLKE